ncbi:hypothetical protein PAMP_021034 [Pampus punctatissimus]
MGGKRRRNGEECCFDVKVDGRVVVRRTGGQERKIKKKGVKGGVGGNTRERVDPRHVSAGLWVSPGDGNRLLLQSLHQPGRTDARVTVLLQCDITGGGPCCHCNSLRL